MEEPRRTWATGHNQLDLVRHALARRAALAAEQVTEVPGPAAVPAHPASQAANPPVGPDRLVDVPLHLVQIGDRYRADLGDLDALAASMDELGLLQPIVLTADHLLLAGGRRLAAAHYLGWTTISAVIVESLTDTVDQLAAERDENTCRKDMTIEEKVRLGRAIEAAETSRAAERQRRGRPSGNFPEGPPGEVRDLVGNVIGLSGRTYAKAREILDTAETPPEHTPDPEVRNAAVEALEELRRSGKVDRAHRHLRAAKSGPAAPHDDDETPSKTVGRALDILTPVLPLPPAVVADRLHASVVARLERTLDWLVRVHGATRPTCPENEEDPARIPGGR